MQTRLSSYVFLAMSLHFEPKSQDLLAYATRSGLDVMFTGTWSRVCNLAHLLVLETTEPTATVAPVLAWVPSVHIFLTASLWQHVVGVRGMRVWCRAVMLSVCLQILRLGLILQYQVRCYCRISCITYGCICSEQG